MTANTGRVVAEQAPEGAWRSARHRWSMAVMFVLILSWLSQGLWATRQEWATLAPEIAPRLNAACIELGCDALPPLVRDAVQIDTSGWTPHAGGFVLSWSLRNATLQSVTTPALELTLMDAQDQVLVRRVLDVVQLGAPAELKPGEVWQTQRLILAEAGLVPSGYRLLSFYP